MRIVRCELFELRLPLRRPFVHAGASRALSEPILARLVDEAGREGLGEIQARPYVTGESNDRIMATTGPALARRLLGLEIESERELLERVDRELEAAGRELALWGGFEGALRALWARRQPLDDALWIGPPRTSPTVSCATVDLVDDPRELRRAALAAGLEGAAVVKVKVGGDPAADRARLETLDRQFRGRVPLRLDGNGALELDPTIELLRECRHLPIHSLEQPFAVGDPRLEEKLRLLREATGIALMADESVVTLSDAEWLARSRVYQIFNLRAGKMGGLRGTVKIARLARAAGIEVVAGTMVGETGLLDEVSRRLLARSEELGYVEGLGQNRFLLETDPVTHDAEGSLVLRPDLPAAFFGRRVELEIS